MIAHGNDLGLIRKAPDLQSSALPADLSLEDFYPTWVPQGLCLRVGQPEDWFPKAGVVAQDNDARQVCLQCPVRTECLTFALEIESNQPVGGRSGIYGGLTAAERAQITGGRQRREATA